MAVTLCPIEMLDMLLQLPNAPGPMTLVCSWTEQLVMEEFAAEINTTYGLLSLPRYLALPYKLYERFGLLKESAPLPTLVMLFGMETDDTLEQPEKASAPMVVTPSSMVTAVSPEQS